MPGVRRPLRPRFSAFYIGSFGVKYQYSVEDLNQVVTELAQANDDPIAVTIELSGGKILAYRSDGQELFSHSLFNIQKFAQASVNKSAIVYIIKEKYEAETGCSSERRGYLFMLETAKKVPELFSVVKEEKAVTPVDAEKLSPIPLKFSRTSSLCGDSPPNFSQFYEVLFLGKIKASHKRAPPSFIDDALQKFKQREILKEQKNTSPTAVDNKNALVTPHHPLETPFKFNNTVSSNINSVSSLANSTHNRTMLLQIGRTDLRLISPDKKQVLLHKNFREISHCSCGQINKEHFGFICREGGHGQSNYLGYVFICDSSNVVEDIMQGLRSAFQAAHEMSKKEKADSSCSVCPMVWFNNLCEEMEGAAPTKAQGIILKNLERLDDKERDAILLKMSGAETPDISEQNQVLMMLLKATCEVKQENHQHIGPSSSLTEEIDVVIPPATPSQDSNVMEAAKRARRSLAESFNGMMRRKASVDVSDVSGLLPTLSVTQPSPVKKNPLPHPLSLSNAERRVLQEKCSSPEKGVISPNKMDPLTPNKHVDFHCDVGLSPGIGSSRQRSRTVGAAGGETMKRELARKRLARLNEESIKEEESSQTSPMISIFMKTASRPSLNQETSSSRQQIFQKVITPDRRSVQTSTRDNSGPRDFRLLWQNAIKQQILLNHMEKENQIMLESEEQLAEKRLKLDYLDLMTGDTVNFNHWEKLLSTSPADEIDYNQLREAVAIGLHQTKRGEIWQLLVSSSNKRQMCTDNWSSEFPNMNADYSKLKSQLTSHQHAILIDLGRTFPNHGYFSGALGPGQCGLFNLLKAYSILDPEVGYCQGLPFCVGMLLMHTEEEPAFQLLKHLMFSEGLRKHFNPDMSGLQVSMYQLTRLLAETHPKLYNKLDQLEVDPSLYATPWFLTLFAAHFPLGFVARVFDLLFLEGPSSIIKVSVCLMVELEEMILASTNLEELMNVLKISLPSLDPKRLEDVIRQAASLNINRQLHTYEVEYQVLQEEQSTSRNEVEKLKKIIVVKDSELVQKESLISNRDKTILSLTRQVAEKVELINDLEDQLQIVNDKLNNNGGFEDKLNRVLQLVEEFKVEAPENVRVKLDAVLECGRSS